MAKHELMVVGPNLPGVMQEKGTFHVHTADCADLKRAALREAVRESGSVMEVENLFEIVTTIYDPSNFDWDETDAGDAAAYWNDFHWAPCVKEIPDGFPEAGADDNEGIAAEDLIHAAFVLDEFSKLMGSLNIERINRDTSDYAELAERLRAAAGE